MLLDNHASTKFWRPYWDKNWREENGSWDGKMKSFSEIKATESWLCLSIFTVLGVTCIRYYLNAVLGKKDRVVGTKKLNGFKNIAQVWP